MNRIDRRTPLLAFLIVFTIGGLQVQAQTFTEHVISTTASEVQDVVAADLDGDGDTDVVAAAFAANEIVWYENQGETSFTRHVISDVDGPYSLFVADVNQDGHPDVVSGSLGDDTVAWYENDGSGSFGGATVIDGSAEAPYSVHAAKIDEDDHLDVVVAAYESDEVTWYRGNGDGTFGNGSRIGGTADGVRSVFAADVDTNGTMDVLSASGLGGTVAWYDQGGGDFDRRLIGENVNGAASVYAADLNGDERPDILSAAEDDNELLLYKNTIGDREGEAFTEQVLSTSVQGIRSVHAADVEGDGDLDVLTASREDDKITVYKNDGRAHFAKQVISTAADGATSVYAADVDGDGTTDVLSASQRDDAIRWYETNLQPVARDTSIEIQENERGQLGASGVLGNDADPDGDSLKAVRLGQPSAGTVSGFSEDGTFTFDPGEAFDSLAAGERRTVSFRYEARDPAGLSDTATVRMTVLGQNDPPVAQSDSDTTHSDTAVTTSVLGNDRDVDGSLDAVSVSVVDFPRHGSVRAAESNTLTYTPDEGYAGEDHYSYVVADEAGGTDTARVTIAIRPLPPAVRANGGDRKVLLEWTPPAEVNVEGYRVYQRSRSAAEETRLLSRIQDSSTTQYEVPELANREVYDFLVAAVGPEGIEGPADTVRAVPRPPEIEWDGEVSFGSFDQTSGYRMVGLPGRSEGRALSSTLSGKGGEDWTALTAPGITSTDALVRFREDSTRFAFAEGRGFWVLSTDSWSPEGAAESVSLAMEATATIPLPEGWSIVTNPFPEPVAWAAVTEKTPGLDATLWGYDGRFSSQSTLKAYEGYYVFNDPDQPVDTLRIPYPTREDSIDAQGGRARATSPGEGGRLVLRARTTETESGTPEAEVDLRVGPRTSEGRDAIDQFAPPGLGERRVQMRVRSDAASEAYPWLRREGRPLGSDQTATFRLQLEARSGQTVHLSTRAGDGLSDLSVLLYDRRTEQIYRLRETSPRLRFAGREREGRVSRSMEVWIGDSEELQKRKQVHAPSELTLAPPAPNPTASATTLRFTVPASVSPVRAQVVVYDVLGREVQRLVDERVTAGRHAVRWRGTDAQGRDLASGVYFCRFIADDEVVDTRKITLLR